jgi:hypothetical protein
MDEHLGSSKHLDTVFPLCRRYEQIWLENIYVLALVEGAVALREVRWALGVHSNTQWEVLGAWSTPEQASGEWSNVFADLQRCGVESVATVICQEPEVIESHLHRAYPTAIVLGVGLTRLLPDRKGSARRSSYVDVDCARPWSADSSVLGCRHIAQQLRSRLSLAIARNNGFADPERACVFVLRALRRAEQRLSTPDSHGLAGA